jgi:hypothetical protein
MTDVMPEQFVDLDQVGGGGPAAPMTRVWTRWMSNSLLDWPGRPVRAGWR